MVRVRVKIRVECVLNIRISYIQPNPTLTLGISEAIPSRASVSLPPRSAVSASSFRSSQVEDIEGDRRGKRKGKRREEGREERREERKGERKCERKGEGRPVEKGDHKSGGRRDKKEGNEGGENDSNRQDNIRPERARGIAFRGLNDVDFDRLIPVGLDVPVTLRRDGSIFNDFE
jgi:hypothetical protein